MAKVVFVGSNPSNSSAELTPFHESTMSKRVIDSWLAKTELSELTVTYCNVISTTTDLNRPLSMKEIRNALVSLKHELDKLSDHKIIALGNTAAKALTLLHIDFYAMPHPSGRNRLLNDEEYVTEKLRGLKEFLESPIIS